ncbi:hypothetical protein PLICRDRAFT_97236 [Plicaturopsis crispa FD-325 SS-3]|nr:hypothetical protein PLICRDRAFT_97236 [Plicaturopsis crispa FD-325 SS-3]
MLFIGTTLYVCLLLVNSVAVLSEDRFLAPIGWAANQPQVANNAFHQPYDQTGYGGGAQPDVGMKIRLINLITAVRTVMRIPLIGFNILIIIYELLLGK